jgi:fluoroquinolone transport system permease protein
VRGVTRPAADEPLPAADLGRRAVGGLVRALVLPVARGLPWRPLLAGGTLGLLIAAGTRLHSGGVQPWLALLHLRAAALAFGLGLAFLMDDPTRHTTATVPVRRLVRAGLRVALVAPVAVGWWGAAVLLVPAAGRPPLGDVTLEVAATAVLALAAAAAAVRLWEEPEPGQAAAAVVLVAGVAAPLLMPDRWTLFVQLGVERWDEAHRAWAWVLACAAPAWVACTVEPVRRPLSGWSRSSPRP